MHGRGSAVLDSCRDYGLTFVVSDLHLTEICLSPNPLSFAAPAERLGAFFLSYENEATLEQLGTVDLPAFDVAKQIEEHAQDAAGLERHFLQCLLPMLKISGGLAEVDIREIEDTYIKSLREGIRALPNDLGRFLDPLVNLFIKVRLWSAERSIRKSFQKITFQDDAAKLASIRNRINADGGMSQLPPEMLVEKVLGMLDDAENKQLRKEFPPGFGIDAKNRSSKVMTLAFLLFTLGAVPKSGKAYRGDAAAQTKKYRAQFLDCMHIGKASNFSAFITNDYGANRLAQAVFAYAGVSARSMLIQRTQHIQ